MEAELFQNIGDFIIRVVESENRWVLFAVLWMLATMFLIWVMMSGQRQTITDLKARVKDVEEKEEDCSEQLSHVLARCAGLSTALRYINAGDPQSQSIAEKILDDFDTHHIAVGRRQPGT